MEAFQLDDLVARRREGGRQYHEFLRVPALSAGVYGLPAGGRDPQGIHGEDEVYLVVKGRGRLWVAGEDRAAGPGSVFFVPAGAEHRFHAIEEDLEVLVLFAPAEEGGTGATGA